MKQIITLLLALFAVTGQAEIYKGTDADGNVIYTDKETPDTKEIQIPDATTIPMPKPRPEQAVKKDSEKQASYKIFTISSPANNETIRINSGDIAITLSVTPELDVEQGHTISIHLDGKTVITKATGLTHQLSNINRGSHSLRADIRGAKNEVLKKSRSITFHMKRQSSQHKNPTGTPSGPRKPDGKPYRPGPQGVIFEPGPITQPPAS